MLIEIDEKTFNQIINLMKNRNRNIHNYLKTIKPIKNITTENTLTRAREIKTQQTKQKIHKSIKELIEENITPSKYKVHKNTKIAYATLNKYYDEILAIIKNKH